MTIPEQAPVPTRPPAPAPLLYIQVLSGGWVGGRNNGTIHRWCNRWPLPSDIPWLSPLKRTKGGYMESVKSTLQLHHNSCNPHLAAFVCLQQKYLKFSLNAMLFLAAISFHCCPIASYNTKKNPINLFWKQDSPDEEGIMTAWNRKVNKLHIFLRDSNNLQTLTFFYEWLFLNRQQNWLTVSLGWKMNAGNKYNTLRMMMGDRSRGATQLCDSGWKIPPVPFTFIAAVEDVREPFGTFEVEKRSNREDQEQAD